MFFEFVSFENDRKILLLNMHHDSKLHIVVDDTERKIMGWKSPNKQPQPKNLPKSSLASTNMVTFLQWSCLITFPCIHWNDGT